MTKEGEGAQDIWEVRKSFIEGQDKEGGKDIAGESIDTSTQDVPNSNGTLHTCTTPTQEIAEDCTEKTPLALPENLLSKSAVSLSKSAKSLNSTLNLSHLGSKYSIVSAVTSGSVISCHNVHYSVEEKIGRCCGKKQDKFILKNVSGIFKPGMNAIMGPTASGKTSLLDTLAGRKDPSGLSGHVLVDGAPQPSNFKCMTGYVTQDDVVMGLLTVRENIAFSAALRLPSSTPNDVREQRVNDVINDLGLVKCADTKVGTAFLRGVSGGERKRTSIGMELITAPPVLFLDEPTTGLDSNTAYSVMHLLKRVSRRGQTIIFSIHQPRSSIYRLFDSLLLLSQGETVYHGPAREALQYFTLHNYICEPHNNPADFFLDVVQGAIHPTQPSENNVPNGQAADFESDDAVIDIEEEDESACAVRQRILTKNFTNSTHHKRLEDELTPIQNSYLNTPDVTVTSRVTYPTSFLRQLYVVGGRTWRNMSRNPHTLGTQCFAALLLSLIIGTIYFQVDSTYKAAVQNRVGAFFFIVMNYVFGNMSSVDIFIKERALFIHENISGFYRVSAYFFSKLFCDVGPNKVFPLLLFASISYWMIGLQADFVRFLLYVLNITVTCVAGSSVALMMSATVQVYSIGAVLTSLIWVFMMVFSGLLVNLDTIAAWLRWLQYLSIFRYSMNFFLINELKDAEFCDHPMNATMLTLDVANSTTSLPAQQAQPVMCDYGNAYLERQGIRYETNLDMWMNEIALCLLALFFLLITYIQLRRIKKLK